MLTSLVDHMVEGVAIYDREGRCLYANHASARFLGKTVDELVGRAIWELIPEAAGATIQQAFARVAAGGPAETVEHLHAPLDIHFETKLELRDDRVHVVARDVSASRRASADAAATELRLTTLAEAIPALVAFVDKDRRYRYVNQGYQRWFGRPREDYVGRTVVEVIGEKAAATVEPHIQRVLAGEAFGFRSRMQYPMGPRDVDVQYVPVRDARGEVTGWVALVLDVSTEVKLAEAERLRYEEQLRANERLNRLLGVAARLAVALDVGEIERAVVDAGLDALGGTRGRMVVRDGEVAIELDGEPTIGDDERTFLEILASHAGEALHRVRLLAELRDLGETREAMIQASPAAIMLLDREGVVHTWNPAAERIFGWSAGDVVGTFLPAIDEAKRDEFLANLERVSAGNVIAGVQARRRRRDGEGFDVELYAAPVRRSDGQTYCLSMVVDITERKRVDAEKARLYAEAEQARQAAEAASLAKDEFLAMLSHELRNPLAPISSALELMRAKHGDSREHAIIERQSRHLTRLVDDLLDVSRITRGKLELDRKGVAVGSFVERAVEMTRDLVRQKNHVLAVSIEPGLVVDGDVTRLAQVVANLLSNSARYTEAGGTIDVSGRRDGDALVLRVRDTGVGIAPEMLPKIFESFVQAPQPIARTTGGLGLGLSIVRTLVELHGGTIVARSEGLGRGTEMEVRLPLATAPAARPSERIPVARPASGRRVLIVDDNQDAAMLLAELLDGYGYMVRTAFDGDSALTVADDHQPEIAILDLGLPHMDGFELARRLRAKYDERGLRLIALSGYNQANDQVRSREAGFAHHVAKPIDLHVLLRLVDEPAG